MRYKDLKEDQLNKYSDDPAIVDLFEKADNLSPSAQSQFVAVWDFEWALDGQVYVGTKMNAKRYPELMAECAAIGIEIVTR